MGILDSFSVGQKLQGRMKKAFNDDLIIDLGGGLLGRVNGGALEVDFEEGKEVSVFVDSISSKMIYLRIDNGQDPSSIINQKSWDGWMAMPQGHSKAMMAMSSLLRHTDAYRTELENARTAWRTEIQNHQRTYEVRTADSRKRCAENCEKFRNDCTINVENTKSRSGSGVQTVEACKSFLNDLGNTGSGAATNAASSRFSSVQKKRDAFNSAIQSKCLAYVALRDCLIADAERLRNEQLESERAEQIEKNNQSDRNYAHKSTRIREACQLDIDDGFNKVGVSAYCQNVKASRFNAANYECPTEIPEYIMFGSIGALIPNSSEDERTVVQSLDLQTAEFAKARGNQYTVQIPYAQRLADGISLLMKYSQTAGEREYAQKLIQPLLLKLFMSFPAGKLEATMIDPLELGASFPDIPQLATGPNSARIIDTKIWSKERDIETAIATLRQRLENLTQAYGDDKEGRLKKEVIRALAITDFPVGFSDSALKDLHAIVRNSASLGVCVLICANEAELNKLKQKNNTLLDEIMACLVQTSVKDNKLVLNGANGRMFLEIDTMDDVKEYKDEIFNKLRDSIEHVVLKIERFEDMFDFDISDSNNWFTGNHEEIAIPLGIKGSNTIVNMVLGRGGGSTEHHALIAGQTGAGKSTLLHTLILSTLISYSPEEVQMYLLDFKEGVEFSIYTKYRLPSLRAVAINSEREFGLNVLKELCKELEDRARHFNRYGVSDINGYFELTDVPKVQKILLIFDEVQELFRNRNEQDNISAECLSCLNRLVMQGRSMGIHVILACQDFRNCSGLEAYFSQMVIRIPVKGSMDAASSILNSDNNGIQTLQHQPAGAAIYNSGAGVEAANNFFQVSYISEEERIALLEKFDAYFNDPNVADIYKGYQTRVLLANAEDNINNCFNKLIIEGPNSIKRLGESKTGYGLLLGMGFGKKNDFIPELSKNNGENLLVVTRDENAALGMFELSAMSVLYEELNTAADKSNALVYIVDLFAGEELSEDQCDFDFFAEQFPQQVRLVKKADIEDLINSLYETLLGRMDGTLDASERIFFMFFGINRARRLRSAGMYDEENTGDTDPITKLKNIITKGPKFGINSIVWGESIKLIESILGNQYDRMFNKRIALGLDEDSMNILVEETNAASLRGRTAAYMDVANDNKNTHFRPYEIPAKIWIERYGETYSEVIGEGDY